MDEKPNSSDPPTKASKRKRNWTNERQSDKGGPNLQDKAATNAGKQSTQKGTNPRETKRTRKEQSTQRDSHQCWEINEGKQKLRS